MVIVIQKHSKYLIYFITALALTCLFAVTAFAADASAVSSAIQGTWDSAKTQIKTVVDDVVFPVLDLVLAVLFFTKLGTAYFDYKKRGEFEWAPPAILFACLLFTITAPTYVWTIIGM